MLSSSSISTYAQNRYRFLKTVSTFFPIFLLLLSEIESSKKTNRLRNPWGFGFILFNKNLLFRLFQLWLLLTFTSFSFLFIANNQSRRCSQCSYKTQTIITTWKQKCYDQSEANNTNTENNIVFELMLLRLFRF